MRELASPSLEHEAETWWPGGKTANRNLEAAQEKVSKQMLRQVGQHLELQ